MKRTPLTQFGERQVALLATLRKLQEHARAVADELLGDLIGDLPPVKLPKPRPAKAKQDKAIAAESFKAFKAAYPRPTGMERAKAVWLVINPDAELVALILSRIELFKRTTWAGREMAGIPHASTFLHQKRWKDAPETPATGRRPDLGRLPPAHDGPPVDLFVLHVDKLKAVLARGHVKAMLKPAVWAAVVKTVNDLNLERTARAAAEEKLEKIEARLLAVLLLELPGPDVLQCERLAQEALGGVKSDRMTDAVWEDTTKRAFEAQVRQLAGLPHPY